MTLIELVKLHEGFRPHRYRDTEGHWTIGYGHKITGSRRIDVPMAREVAESILAADLGDAMRGVNVALPWLRDHPCGDVRRGVIYEMAFQLGVTGVLKFKNTLLMLKHERYKEASWAILDSKLAKQTPNRAADYARRMLAGSL